MRIHKTIFEKLTALTDLYTLVIVIALMRIIKVNTLLQKSRAISVCLSAHPSR